MEQIPSFNALIEKSIIDNWDLDSLTDYKGKTLQYHDVARKIEKLHIMFEASGVQRGDKIALCGRNSAAWAAAFLAILTYGAVAVPILHEFTPDQVHNIVNHSDAKLLFIGDVAATQIDATKMPGLEGIIYIPDYSLVVSRTEQLTYAREHLNEMFGKKYPKYFRQQHVHYYREQSPDELALINYTSGTTGRSKGVMLPYRSLWSNADFAFHVLGKTLKRGDNVISFLPMAHMYGMAFEFIFEFLKGMHIYYLNRVPSPAVIAQALADVKPRIMIAVPLVIEKIIRKKVFPKLQTNKMRLLMAMPVISKKVRAAILAQVSKAFGGNLYEVIIGGAALNGEVEAFLRKIGFPYTVGYGATECGPIICYRDWQTFAQGSCGQAAYHQEVRIDSSDPANVPGRDPHQGSQRPAGLLQESRGHPGGDRRRGMVPHGRPRHDGRRRQCLYQRPIQEHAPRIQRPEHLSRGDRGQAQLAAPRRREHRCAAGRQTRGPRPSRLRRGEAPGPQQRRPQGRDGAKPPAAQPGGARLQQGGRI